MPRELCATGAAGLGSGLEKWSDILRLGMPHMITSISIYFVSACQNLYTAVSSQIDTDHGPRIIAMQSRGTLFKYDAQHSMGTAQHSMGTAQHVICKYEAQRMVGLGFGSTQNVCPVDSVIPATW